MLRDGKTWQLPKAKLNEYKTTYPDIDIEAELRKASQWLIDNPTKRKTAKGMTRYLGGWLSRAKPSQPEEHRGNKPRVFTQAEEEKFFDEFVRKNAPTAEQADKFLAEVGE